MEHSRRLNKFILEKGLERAGALASLGFLFFTLAGTVDILGLWIYIAIAILYVWSSRARLGASSRW